MLRKNKRTLIVTSLITLLPMLWGLLLWNQLPQEIITNWSFSGSANQTSSRGFVVFGIPLILLFFQLFSVLCTALDPQNRDRNQKPLKLILWVIPVLSNLVLGLIYAISLGKQISPVSVIQAFLGLLFVAIGNYLPKCRQNSTLGLRIYWTMKSEENWNATHRFAGKVWVIGGILMVGVAFLPTSLSPWLFLAALLVIIALPLGYSYRHYRRETKG